MSSTATFAFEEGGQVHPLTVTLDEEGGLWVDAEVVEERLGWTLTERGLCQGSLCVPRSLLGPALREGALELGALGRLIGRPLHVDHVAGRITFGAAGQTAERSAKGELPRLPRRADSDDDIAACFPVLHQLRPHLWRADFLGRVRRQEATGYRLALLEDDRGVVCVAGFRILENLAWGRFLYVDDLVTAQQARGAGHGATMLRWLRGVARDEGCDELHLDSGNEKVEAHRFYLREGLEHTSLHFRAKP